MVRFYYTDANYLEINAISPTIREEKYNQINHIPYSTKIVVNQLGFSKSTDIEINFKNETDFNSFCAVLDDIQKISVDGTKYYKAYYNGNSFKKLMWAGVYTPNIFSFVLEGLQYSLSEKTKGGADICSNEGNYYATPKFTITVGASAGKTSFTISDGVRVLTYTGPAIVNGKVIVIDNWNCTYDGVEHTEYLSGDYPLVPPNQSNFKFTFVNITTAEVSIKYRDTWR